MRKATFCVLRHSLLALLMVTTVLVPQSIKAQNDCPNLTVFCQDLHTSFMPNACMVEVWAKDFIRKINMGEDSLGTYQISFSPDSLVMNRVFQSENGNSYNDIQIWVTDPRCDPPVTRTCIVSLDINDNTNACDGPTECVNSPYVGYAVATCTAPFGSGGSVGVIYDVRRNQSDAPKGCDWDDLPEITPSNWNIDSIGPLFGIALDEFDNIYLGASDVYRSNYTPVNGLSRTQIFKASPPEFRAEPFVALPNRISGTILDSDVLVGIGNIAYNYHNNLLYASNLEDGKIYMIDLSGNILDSFDPWQFDDNVRGLPSQSEQIWGIQFNREDGDSKLYFARITDSSRSMHSITLGTDGSFPARNQIATEFSNIPGVRSRITDISFSKDGNIMIFAERGTNFIPQEETRGPHEAKVLKYSRNSSTGSWSQERQLYVGERLNVSYAAGENSAGGVDFGYRQQGNDVFAECDSLVWATANLMRLPSSVKTVPGTNLPYILYGMEGMPTSGNIQFDSGDTLSNMFCDLFKDFDGDYTDPEQNLNLDLNDKGRIGDIEVYRCRQKPEQISPSVAESVVRINGTISSATYTPLSDVMVRLSGKEMQEEIMTSEYGYFTFDKIEKFKHYELVPFGQKDDVVGLSTVDLIKLQRHIIGKELLQSPYELVAADVNQSGTISARDIIEMKRVLLGYQKEFTNNNSWVFMSHTGAMNANDYENSMYMETLDHNVTANFTGVKLGDINFSHPAYLPADTRNLESTQLYYHTSSTSQGTLVKVFATQEFSCYGLELDIKIEGANQIRDLNSELLQISDFSRIHENLITVRLAQDFETKKDVELFSFLVGGQYDNIQLTSTKGLGFISDEYSEVNVDFLRKDPITTTLTSVYPNPINSNSSLLISSQIHQNLVIESYTLEGKILSRSNLNVKAGTTHINVQELGIRNHNEQKLFLIRITGADYNKVHKVLIAK